MSNTAYYILGEKASQKLKKINAQINQLNKEIGIITQLIVDLKNELLTSKTIQENQTKEAKIHFEQTYLMNTINFLSQIQNYMKEEAKKEHENFLKNFSQAQT